MKTLLVLFLTVVAATAAIGAEPAPTPAAAPTLQETILPKDRVLFVGDEMTQQMFYTRAVASALLALRPDDDLRFFNGGKDEATAQAAAAWIDDVVSLAQPTVVMVAFGLNDGKSEAPSAENEKAFHDNLRALVEKIQAHEGVRKVIVLGPPSIQVGQSDRLDAVHYDQTLAGLSRVAMQVATECKAGYIDLCDYTKAVYAESTRVGGEPLTMAGRLPNEAAHIVIASVILKGLGVTKKELEPIGWSPLVPRKMQQVRLVLAIPLKAPGLEAAQQSHDLYEGMRPFDEAFFRIWRLAGKHPSAPSRQTLWPNADEAWVAVRNLTRPYVASR